MYKQRVGLIVGSMVLGLAIPIAAQQGGAGGGAGGAGGGAGQGKGPGAGAGGQQGQGNQGQGNRPGSQPPGGAQGQGNQGQGNRPGNQPPGGAQGQGNQGQGIRKSDTPPGGNPDHRNATGTAGQRNQQQAQRSGGIRGPRPWFWDPKIRQQLGIPDSAYPRMEQLYGQNFQRFNNAFSQLDNLDEQTRNTRTRELRNTFFKNFGEGLTDMLPADQRNRLGQAALQFRGFDAFFDPTVATRLRLTDLQLQQLAAFNDRWNTDLGLVLADANAATADRRYADLRADQRKQILQVLTPEQDKLWMEMTGDPIAFALSSEVSPGASGGDSPSHGSPLDQAFDRTSQATVQCQRVCDTCAAHCVRMVANARIEHLITLRTCQDCADACSTASRVLSRHGPLYEVTCRACADACAQCAQVCAQHPDDPMMKACADECRACEKACRDFLESMRQNTQRN